MQFNVSNLRLAPALVSYYTKILKGMQLSNRAEKTRSFLASSPVKGLLSTIWGGGSNSNTDQSPKHARTPVSSAVQPSFSRGNSETNSIFGSAKSREGVRVNIDDKPDNPLVRLEQTFTGYVASLQSRKGSIIGRMLLNRAVVDETAVNDLYNRLIESPFDLDASADLTPDVIFVAFEKFLHIAWREQMGPVMTIQSLDTLQERLNRQVPGNFSDFVHYMFGDMAPQNRRAFTALIKLLADLLDGCGNDSDRGVLTVAFAELLVPDGSAHNYINLLDRLVDDCDRIFEDTAFGSNPNHENAAYESENSATRSAKAGSMTSNTSSIRRKFGFDTLLRQNSKNEDRLSVWRTLSKHSRNPATGDVNHGSLSRAAAGRTRSIDMGNGFAQLNRFRRPDSRDRPPIVGAFEEPARPTSSHPHDPRLETIGEPGPEAYSAKTPRRKRRSSLSDLKSLMEAATIREPEEEAVVPLSTTNKQTSDQLNSAPATKPPTPSRIPVSPASQNLRTPRLQKENFSLVEVFQPSPPTGSNRAPKRRSKALSVSHIPTLKPARSAPPFAGEVPTRPTTSPTKASGSGRLRLQSPQKLRERLQTEKQVVEEVDASLRSELSRITEEMSRVNSGLAQQRPRSGTVDLKRLAHSVAALEERVPAVMAQVHQRHAAMQRDMDNTLAASEAKVKAIDQLYKETKAENELLYEKFNGELGKIIKALRGKGREDKEELVGKLREQSEEAARLKKENMRLRREMASLRSALKGVGGGIGDDA